MANLEYPDLLLIPSVVVIVVILLYAIKHVTELLVMVGQLVQLILAVFMVTGQ